MYKVLFTYKDGQTDYITWVTAEGTSGDPVLYRTKEEAIESAEFFMESGDFQKYIVEEV